jgi:hypothetical protein
VTNRKCKLGVEGLETRELMAGNITAFVSQGHLYVTESPGHQGKGQAVAVSQLADGKLRVKGLWSQDGGYSKVNGAAYKDFFVTGDLKVELGAGNDTIKLVRNTAIKGIDINMTSANAAALTDKDVVGVDGIRTDNQLSIRTGAGVDTVNVYDSIIGNDGSIYDNLDIKTGAGQDTVKVFTLNRWMEVKGHIFVSTYNGAETETDRVTMESVTARRHIAVMTGGGQDVVNMTNVFSGSDILISTDAGNDTVTLREMTALDDFWVYMGDQNDKLSIQYLNADEMTLDGGAGTDFLFSFQQGNTNVFNKTGFEL